MKSPVLRIFTVSLLMIGILSIAPIWSLHQTNAQIIILPTFIIIPTFTPTSTLTPTRTPSPINIGNFVWDDVNKDGIQGSGEPGVPNVEVELWSANKATKYDSTFTSISGNYTLVAPQPGSYRIRVIPPAGAFISPKDVGIDNLIDSDINPTGPDAGYSDTFTLASNIISTTIWDIGLILFRDPTPTRTPTPVNIGNFVWHDLNQNGIQDAGEPGIGNVQVQLWNSTKTELLYSTYSAASGSYTVVAPRPGSYRIRVLPPAGSLISPKDVGIDDLIDSDINPTGPDAGYTNIFTLPSNLISTTLWDIGLMNVTSTPTLGATNTPTATNTATVTNTPTATTPAGTPSTLPRKQYLPYVRR